MEHGTIHAGVYHQRHRSDNGKPMNLPRGDSSYARGKRAEYIQKDLELAKYFYMEAIKENDRLESAVKDITSILHQQHRTWEACEFLERFETYFSDPVKYRNLHNTISRQINGTGNSLNKILKLTPTRHDVTPVDVTGLFYKPSRIQGVQSEDSSLFVSFASHSAARKTLESFWAWDSYRVEWVSADGTVLGEAKQGQTVLRVKNTMEEAEEKIELPDLNRDPSENTAVLLLGKSLYQEI